MTVMFLINAGVGDCGGDDDVGNVVTREHDVGDHADAPEVGVQGQGLVVHHLVASSMISIVNKVMVMINMIITIIKITAFTSGDTNSGVPSISRTCEM